MPQTFAIVSYVRKMTSKLSCKCEYSGTCILSIYFACFILVQELFCLIRYVDAVLFLLVEIEGFRLEWFISTMYHAWDTPFWSGTLKIILLYGNALVEMIPLYGASWFQSCHVWCFVFVFFFFLCFCHRLLRLCLNFLVLLPLFHLVNMWRHCPVLDYWCLMVLQGLWLP